MQTDYSDKNPSLARNYPAHIQTLCARHDHALEKAGASHAVILSGSLKYAFLDDHPYPFKANPHFLHWLPLSHVPNSCIVYAPGDKPVLVFNQPRDYWHSVPASPDGYWVDQFDVRIIHDAAEIGQHLPADRSHCILIGEDSEIARSTAIERVNPKTVINSLHYARGIKTNYELDCLRLASIRGAQGHLAAKAGYLAGASEFEIHQRYCTAVSHTDNELPYSNIIARNHHAAILHYTELARVPPEKSHSFLIDAGAQVHGYASDITRTYAHNDPTFQALIERVNSMQQDIVAAVRPGVDYRELHIDTHRRVAALLVDAGLASGDPDVLLSSGVTSAFLPHGLGHLLGLQVHDVGGHMQDEAGNIIDAPSGHPFLRLTRVLEENMVLTIEPGLYIIDLLLEQLRGTDAERHVNWAMVDRLRPFGGIRIEDDIRVTSDGCENLTRDAFAAVATHH